MRRRAGQKSQPVISLVRCPAGLSRAVKSAALFTLRRHRFKSGTLEIAFVGPKEMSRIHHDWMAKRAVTDVITFDLRERRDRSVDGQVIVCPTVAKAEARRRGGAWQSELLLYVIHGCLHLCGYDDRRPAAARRMSAEQERILGRLAAPKWPR